MGLYNATNLNKRAITLDMQDPRGTELFWRLLPGFDVFAESFSPHVLPNWGVTYETLQDARPDIIFASLSGYGTTGPYTQTTRPTGPRSNQCRGCPRSTAMRGTGPGTRVA